MALAIRSAEVADVGSCGVRVSGVPQSWSKQQVHNYFAQHGEVRSVHSRKDASQSLCEDALWLVKFHSPQSAAQIVVKLHRNAQLDGRTLRCKLQAPSKVPMPSSASYGGAPVACGSVGATAVGVDSYRPNNVGTSALSSAVAAASSNGVIQNRHGRFAGVSGSVGATIAGTGPHIPSQRQLSGCQKPPKAANYAQLQPEQDAAAPSSTSSTSTSRSSSLSVYSPIATVPVPPVTTVRHRIKRRRILHHGCGDTASDVEANRGEAYCSERAPLSSAPRAPWTAGDLLRELSQGAAQDRLNHTNKELKMAKRLKWRRRRSKPFKHAIRSCRTRASRRVGSRSRSPLLRRLTPDMRPVAGSIYYASEAGSSKRRVSGLGTIGHHRRTRCRDMHRHRPR